MNLIVAVADSFAIGYKGDLLIRISNDLKRFRELTTGKVVVMGYNTFLSMPGSKPLKNRTNIVLCPDSIEIEGATVVHSMPELFQAVSIYQTDDVFVIGGGMVYTQLLPFCKKAYITKIYKTFQADTFIPDLDSMPSWNIIEQSDEMINDDGTKYRYVLYANSDCQLPE